jgi:hypothetical protein
VPTPADVVTELIDDVEDVAVAVPSLSSKLDGVFESLSAANAATRNDATNQLNAFINAVAAQSGKKLTPSDADALIASARRIIASLS